jgi:Heliorhodopsin
MTTMNAITSPTIATGVTPERLRGLRTWNLALAALHLAQAIAILVLTGSFKITVTSTVPEGPPGTRLPAAEEVFKVPVGIAIFLFLLLAAADHFLTATAARTTYERDLKRGINRFRWAEYSISATLMILLISMYGGITGIDALFAIIGCNVAMILFGWLQEAMNPPGRSTTTMLPFWFGVVAGLAPWFAIAYNVIGSKTIPGFVYGIVISEAVFFFSFGLNQWLQYRGVGKWADYAYGEKTYLVLSLVAKSLLAWQIFGGSLSPE